MKRIMEVRPKRALLVTVSGEPTGTVQGWGVKLPKAKLPKLKKLDKKLRKGVKKATKKVQKNVKKIQKKVNKKVKKTQKKFNKNVNSVKKNLKKVAKNKTVQALVAAKLGAGKGIKNPLSSPKNNNILSGVTGKGNPLEQIMNPIQSTGIGIEKGVSSTFENVQSVGMQGFNTWKDLQIDKPLQIASTGMNTITGLTDSITQEATGLAGGSGGLFGGIMGGGQEEQLAGSATPGYASFNSGELTPVGNQQGILKTLNSPMGMMGVGVILFFVIKNIKQPVKARGRR